MSLLKQLFLMILVLFLLLFAGTFLISVHSVYQFSQEQLRSNAQDTAASLGLSLSEPLKKGDQLLVERMIDAIFDRGFYWRMTLVNVDGEVVYEKISTLKYGDAPNWLMRFFEIMPPEEQSLLKVGWQNAGILKVVSHPRYLNLQLWEVFKETFWWFSFVSLVTLVLAVLLLKFLLKPLSEVVQQAQAICHREFPIQKTLPWTIDFKIVILAMNKLSHILKKIFQEHSRLTEVLKEKVYQDPVTELGNRRYFMEQLDFLLQAEIEKQDGALLLIRLVQFSEYKQRWGYQAADTLLKNVATYLNDFGILQHAYVFGSLDGGDFALSLPYIRKPVLEKIAHQITADLNLFYDQKQALEPIAINMGMGAFSYGDDAQIVFKNAELALRAAESSGQNRFEMMGRFQPNLNLEPQQWRGIFEMLLETQKITMYAQPVVQFKGQKKEIIQYEMLMRCLDQQGDPLSPRNMLIQAEELGVLPQLDIIMFQQVCDLLKADPKRFYAINLSVKTLVHDGFWDGLKALLEKNKADLKTLVVEFPEFAVKQHLEDLIMFSNLVRPYGIRIALDNFGREFSSFHYLERLPIDYIKIHGSYIRGINHHLENQSIVRSFVEIAHGLDIQVIALGVETDLELATLQTFNVDAYQGFWIGQPKRLEPKH